MLNSKTFGTTKSSNRSAFTLIELSIVLIIIGLLVAGVTGGSSLIKSAQLRSLMSEVRGYSVAVNSFKVQFDELPGDYGHAISGDVNSEAGDENGRIEFVNGDNTTPDQAEGVNAWIQLLNSNTIDDTFSGYAADDHDVIASATFDVGTAGDDYPDSRLDGVGWLFDYTTVNSDAANVLVATGTPTALTSHTIGTAQLLDATGALANIDALSIDTKLDDGVADEGAVRASVQTAACNDVAGADYDTTDNTESCALEFIIDIS